MSRTFLAIIASIGFSLAGLSAATSVSQFGITWTFDKDYPTGQFANGDWWVVGPVTITSISPKTTNGQHGSMLNPRVNNNQGFDSRIKNNTYDSSLNVASTLPLTIQPNSSLLSSKSYASNASGDNPQLETIAILTVLSTVPPPGSFRPPYQGTDKSILANKSQLDYSALRSLPKISGTPDLSAVTASFRRPWIELRTSWVGRYLHPGSNQPAYGREMANQLALGLLSLQLDYTQAQKEELLINLVQIGIDIYGAARLGARWENDGGHNYGRKMPLLLAAATLKHPGMLEYSNGTNRRIFQEDQQTFYVSHADIALVHKAVNGAATEDYTLSDLGLAEWGFKHHTAPSFDNKRWSTPYRVMFSCVIGHALTARLMGLHEEWNWPAFFDFADRYWIIENQNRNTGVNSIQSFAASMWDAYRNEADSGGLSRVSAPYFTPSAGFFDSTVNVTIGCATPNSTIYYTLDGSEPTASSLLYTGSVNIGATSTLRASAIASGYAMSQATAGTYTIKTGTTNNSWSNQEVSLPSGKAVLQFDAKPSDFNIDSVIGLAHGDATSFTELAAIIRFSPDGTIDARNGGAYQAVDSYAYEANKTYRFTIIVDTERKRYDATVQEIANPVNRGIIAENFAFRTEQQEVALLDRLAHISIGSAPATVSNIVSSPPAEAPTFYPSPGLYDAGTTINLASASPEAKIYYTIDGSEPSLSATQYSGPISLNSSATFRAIAKAEGYSSSPTSAANYLIGSVSALQNQWTNLSIVAPGNTFVIQFDAEPFGPSIDGVMGLADGPSSAFSHLAVALRFNTNGQIDARDGSVYKAQQSMSYQVGKVYRFTLDIDVASKTYSAEVYEVGSPSERFVLANNYAFRTEQQSVETLSSLAFISVDSLGNSISRIRLDPEINLPPVAPTALRL